MNEKQNNIIQQYLNGELSDKEKLDFEEKIRLDEALADEVSLEKLSREVISIYSVETNKEKLRQWKEEEKQRMKRRKWLWLFFFVVVIGLGAIILYRNFFQPLQIERENQAIAQQMEEELVGSSPFRGENIADVDSVILQLDIKLSTYQQGKDFETAIRYCENFIDANPQRIDTNSDLQWMIAFLHLKNNNRKQAILLLEKISLDDEHNYQTKAKKILLLIQ